ncbi:SDR family NAD(P)-dependent oxidoreductase [Streptomyces sp. SID8352]|nr:SDR family NAD(P)-dependent oxidoreductase [Streptomyces sp. SID8352]
MEDDQTTPIRTRASAAVVDLFRRASADENPLHVDPGYARRTAFGAPVVHGVLGALLTLSGLEPRPGRVPVRISARFHAPVHADQEYTREIVEDTAGRAVARLRDGSRALLEVTAEFRPVTGTEEGTAGAPRVVDGSAPGDGVKGASGAPDSGDGPGVRRVRARDAALGEFAPGLALGEGYAPRWAAVDRLVGELGLKERGLGPEYVGVLAWISYLAGMEAPGRAALLSDFEAVFRPEDGAGGPADGFTAAAEVADVRERFRMLRLTGRAGVSGVRASVDVRAFHRAEAPVTDVGALAAALPGGEPLRGRTALVVGASRGLGAAVAQALALQGAVVYAGFHHGAEEARAAAGRLGEAGARLRPVPGDAADPEWAAGVLERVRAEYGGLDVLVLNAGPTPAELPLEPGTSERAAAHVARALALVREPLAALAAEVAGRGGGIAVISSAWAAAPPPGWSAYVTAKCAVEGLVRAAAAEHPGAAWLIARPPRLRTGMTAAALGGVRNAPVEPVAAALADALGGSAPAGGVRVLSFAEDGTAPADTPWGHPAEPGGDGSGGPPAPAPETGGGGRGVAPGTGRAGNTYGAAAPGRTSGAELARDGGADPGTRAGAEPEAGTEPGDISRDAPGAGDGGTDTGRVAHGAAPAGADGTGADRAGTDDMGTRDGVGTGGAGTGSAGTGGAGTGGAGTGGAGTGGAGTGGVAGLDVATGGGEATVPAGTPQPVRDRDLGLVATFTLDPLLEPLQHWCDRLGLGLAVRPAGYGQVFQELLSPGGVFATQERGAKAVLVRTQDWPDGEAGRTAGEFVRAVRTHTARSPVPLLVLLCPPSPGHIGGRGRDEELTGAEALIARELDRVPGVHVLGRERWAGGTVPAGETHHDGAREAAAHIPFTREGCAALAAGVARAAHGVLTAPTKVIVLDCDNTLWGGVVGEDGPRGVRLGPAHRAVQEWAVARRAEGVLLCLASKNEAADVEEVLAVREDMPLRPGHITARRVNWEPKALSLASLAAELDLGLDGFLFLDDNPVEVAAVRAAHPEVLAVRLPGEDEDVPAFLDRLWSVDRLAVTDEDRRRADFYRARGERDAMRRDAASFTDFIAGLGLVVDVAPATPEQYPRLSQLTYRTNQFNLSTVRRGEAELRALAAGPGVRVRAVRVRDRFGDYGLVGLAVTRPDGEGPDGEGPDAVLDTFLLSCRVLGRGVEHALLAAVARDLAGAGVAGLVMPFVPSPRNTPVGRFFDSVLGSRAEPGEDGRVRYRAPVAEVAGVVFAPEGASAGDAHGEPEGTHREGVRPEGAPELRASGSETALSHEAVRERARRRALTALAEDPDPLASVLRATGPGAHRPDSAGVSAPPPVPPPAPLPVSGAPAEGTSAAPSAPSAPDVFPPGPDTAADPASGGGVPSAPGGALARAREAVCAAVAEVTGVPRAELGGHTTLESVRLTSLAMVDAIVRLEERYGRLSTTLFFEHRTLGEVAAVLAGDDPDATPAPGPRAVPQARPQLPTGAPVRETEGKRATGPAAAGTGAASAASPAIRAASADGSPGDRGHEPVAVVGLAGRYPGARDLEELWRNVLHGRSAAGPVPADRWDHASLYTPGGGPGRTYSGVGNFLDGVADFDPLYFHIAPRDAEQMDPQQRVFLETAVEAVQDAGYDRHSLERNTGVYVGAMADDYRALAADAAAAGRAPHPYTDTYGIANRVSYVLDLSGPSMVVDTACSSSGVALHLACEAIRRGEVEAAIAGGVNLVLHPVRHIQYAQMGMLSRADACRPFSAGADGFVMGEGAGAVLLKPLSRALADGDHIHGLIRGTAVNSGGRTSGFTVPSPEAQTALVSAALRSAGVDPSTIGYVEAHGSGTPLGDPIEVRALRAAFGERGRAGRCALGSVKANIGHLEPAAAIAGLTKVLLQFRHRVVPPTPHADTPSPFVELDGGPFRLQSSAEPWEPEGREADGGLPPLRAGVSSFGAGGVNAHLVVEAYGAATARPEEEGDECGGTGLYVLSARTERQLRSTAARLAAHLRGPSGRDARPADVAHTLRVGREALDVRAAFTARCREELLAALDALAGGSHEPNGVREMFGAHGGDGAHRTEGGDGTDHAVGPVGTGRPDGGGVARAEAVGGGSPLVHRGRLVRGGPLAGVFSGPGGGQDFLASLVARDDLDTLARLWTQGAEPDWPTLLPAARRTPLPAYPFERTAYWLPSAAPVQDGGVPAPGAGGGVPAPGTGGGVPESGAAAPRRGSPAPRPGTAVTGAAVAHPSAENRWPDPWQEAEQGQAIGVWAPYWQDRAERRPAGGAPPGTVVVLDAPGVPPVGEGDGDGPWALLRAVEYPEGVTADGAPGVALRRGDPGGLLALLERAADRGPVVLVDRRACGAGPATGDPVTAVLRRLPAAAGRALCAGALAPLTHVQVTPADSEDPVDGAVAAFGRALARETSRFRHVRVRLAEGAAPSLRELVAEADGADAEVRIGPGGRQVLRFARTGPAHGDDGAHGGGGGGSDDAGFSPGAHYLVTGGAGGIGRLVAEHLAARYGARITLVGRSAPGPGHERFRSRLRSLGGDGQYLAADVTDRAALDGALRTARSRFGALDGVLHAAGVVEDAPLRDKDDARMARVLAPKTTGTVLLDELTVRDRLRLFVLFSSVVGTVGNAGQCDYAAANAYLDAFAVRRDAHVARGARYGRTVSVAWPLWSGGGMRLDAEAASLAVTTIGLVPIGTGEALGVLEQALRSGAPRLYVSRAGAGRTRAVLGLTGLDEAAGAAPVPPGVTAPAPDSPAAQDPAPLAERVRALVTARVAEAAGIAPEGIDPAVELGAYGFNSVLLTALANRLNDTLGTALTPVLFYEFPTVDAVSRHLMERHIGIVTASLADRSPDLAATAGNGGPADASAAASASGPAESSSTEGASGPEKTPGPVGTPGAAGTSGTSGPHGTTERHGTTGGPSGKASAARPGGGGGAEPVAVVGLAGRFPGAPDAETFWRNLRAGRDMVTEIPAERWDWRSYDGDPRREPGTSDCRAGGFLDSVTGFDATHFSLSPREAALMDPQQRLFLETCWHALEDAGYDPRSFAGSRTGVFAGATLHDYLEVLGAHGTAAAGHTVTGNVHAIVANRVSYLLDLRGPSETVDTACSSSLVALHHALAALRSGECDAALVGGVNVVMTPTWYVSLSRGGMLSPGGRCHTFDSRADGYVRAEGVGAVLLKPLSRALADGDTVRAVIRGSAVGHGGRSHSLTAPTPRGQADTVVAALRDAGVAPESVGYVEAHGTGTRLGDPIEVQGLRLAYERASDGRGAPAGTTVLGALKASVGHPESAAGVAGLIAVVHALRDRTLPPVAGLDVLNPLLELEGSPFRVLRAAEPWTPSGGGPLRAGLSSFGFGGVNAHVVVEEPPVPAPRPEVRPGPQVVVLSARTREQLSSYAERLRDAVARDGARLDDLAWTSQTGRTPLAERLAVVASSRAELCERLSACLRDTGEAGTPGVHLGGPHPGAADGPAVRPADPADAAARWAAGERVDWTALHDTPRRRVPFPGYPFDHGTAFGPTGMPARPAPGSTASDPGTVSGGAPAGGSANGTVRGDTVRGATVRGGAGPVREAVPGGPPAVAGPRDGGTGAGAPAPAPGATARGDADGGPAVPVGSRPAAVLPAAPVPDRETPGRGAGAPVPAGVRGERGSPGAAPAVPWGTAPPGTAVPAAEPPEPAPAHGAVVPELLVREWVEASASGPVAVDGGPLRIGVLLVGARDALGLAEIAARAAGADKSGWAVVRERSLLPHLGPDEYDLDLDDHAAGRDLAGRLYERYGRLDAVADLADLSDGARDGSPRDREAARIGLLQELVRRAAGAGHELSLLHVTRGREALGNSAPRARGAAMAALVRSVGAEYRAVRAASVDLDPVTTDPAAVLDAVRAELAALTRDPGEVCLRGTRRWVPGPLRVLPTGPERPDLDPGRTYLVTGGTSGGWGWRRRGGWRTGAPGGWRCWGAVRCRRAPTGRGSRMPRPGAGRHRGARRTRGPRSWCGRCWSWRGVACGCWSTPGR